LAARQNDQFPQLLFGETDKPITVVNGNKKQGCTSFEKNGQQTPRPTQVI
jgi:hypothetical protein